MTALSLRRLWTMYKRLLAADGLGTRDLVFAQAAFYAEARGQRPDSDEWDAGRPELLGLKRSGVALMHLSMITRESR